MKRINVLLITVIVLSAIIVIASLYYTCSFEQGINLGANLISSLSGLITMVIAFLLIDKFGFDKKTANFQMDSVIKLIQALSNFSCLVSGNNYHYQIPFTDDLIRQKEIMTEQNDGNKKLVFLRSDNDSVFQDINNMLNDYWLPDSIKTNLKFLEYYGFIEVHDKKELPKNSLTAKFGGTEKQEIMLIQDSTFQEFILNVEKLNRVIRKWWSEHSNITLQMNLKPE